MTVEEQWQRDAALAHLGERIEQLRAECRAAYAVWNELCTRLHRMEIEHERWQRELRFAKGDVEA